MSMSEGAWALIGVGTGVLGSGVLQIGQTVLHRRWTRSDARQAREDRDRERIFEHKREAYFTFGTAITEIERAFGVYSESGAASTGGTNPLLPVIRSAEDALSAVRIYGSSSAAFAAAGLLLDLSLSAMVADPNGAWPEYDEMSRRRLVGEAKSGSIGRRITYEAAVRQDLGLDGADLDPELD